MKVSKADRAEKAGEDLELYRLMDKGGNLDGCILVEQSWGLDGLPPNLVTAVLAAVSEGKTVSKAMTDLGM